MRNIIIEYIVNNISKETLSFIKSIGSPDKYSSVQKRLKNKEKNWDDATEFLIKKHKVIDSIIASGFKIGSFSDITSKERQSLMNTYIHFLIDDFRGKGSKGERFLKKMKVLDVEEINNEESEQRKIEDKMTNDTIDEMKRIRDNFYTLLLEEKDEISLTRNKVVWTYITHPGNEVDKRTYRDWACDRLGIKARMFFILVANMKEEATAFYKENCTK